MSRVLVVFSERIDPVDTIADMTRRRCDRALDAWNRGSYDVMVLTGGKFLPPSVQTESAAALMQAYMVGKGVPEESLLIEEDSVDTYENVVNTIRLLRQRGIPEDQITIVSDRMHVRRIRLTFWYIFDIEVASIGIDHPTRTWANYFLELLVLWPCHYLDTHGTGPLATYNQNKRRKEASSHSA